MTDKDREQYLEVLFALAGHGNYNREAETIKHEDNKEEVVCKSGLRFRKALKILTFGCI